MFLHTDLPTLRRWRAEGGDFVGLGRAHYEDGTGVSSEAARRLTCDAALVPVARDEKGDVLDIGRRSRTIPPALRRALRIRDKGCRWPGCGLPFDQAHHVRYWALGGETKLENLVSLCRFHHRKVHEGGWEVELEPGTWRATFVYPRGRMHSSVPPRDAWGKRRTKEERKAAREARERRELVRALVGRNRRRGIDPDGWGPTPRYERESDVPWQVFARAEEAMTR